MSMLDTVILIVLIPLAGATINGLLGSRLGKISGYIGSAAVGASWLLSLRVLIQVLGGASLDVNVYEWIAAGTFKAAVGFQVDALSTVMIVTVTTVSFFIHIYSFGYMGHDPGFARFYAYLNLFVFSMLVLVLANNYLMMFVGWEGVGLCSYLLIGFWYTKKTASDAGKKAFIVNRIGDFGFLIGMFVMITALGTVDFSEVYEKAPVLLPAGTATAIALLLFVGACGKSAQFPLYVWLPDAMEGPTPVSSLIHAATMVTAGVYMVARSNVLYTMSPTAGAVVAWVGVITALLAATIALVNTDIKRVLAYSTVSQLGYMFIGVGVGAYTAGVFHLFTHAFFKGLMFLAAGSVMHAMSNELDMRKMGGLLSKMKITGITFWIGALAIAGVPPLSGFWSKDEILASAYKSGHPAIWALGVVGAMMTAFYMFRLIFMTFHGAPRDRDLHDHAHESPSSMTVPLIVLAIGSAFVGFVGYPPGHGLIDQFLGTVVGAHHAPAGHSGMSEGVLVGISVLAAALGIGIAYFLHRRGRLGAESTHPVHGVLTNKWYVDELYNAVIVQPIRRISDGLWTIFDTIFVDGLVNALGYLVKGIGWLTTRVQSGNTPTYALWIVLGTVVTLYFTRFP